MEKLSWLEIFMSIIGQFTPVWIVMAIIFTLSVMYKRRLGLYGRLFDSPVGMAGFGIVLFWVLTALLADFVVTHDPLSQVSGMKNKVPGTPVRGVDGTWCYLAITLKVYVDCIF